jgi:NAD(P)-dependent dehydrogenase (short-subunit alcohol dehydrogenase family)
VGRAIAERLGAAGASVCLIARSGAEIESAAASIENKTMIRALDVTDRASVDRAFADIDGELGPVSILVNNAGTLDAIGPLWESDPDVWWRDVEVHLRGTLLCSHAALTRMISRDSGRVINVGGMLGQQGEPYSTAYTSAKAAMYRLSECLSNELGGTGVRVFCMSPGPVRTRMTQTLAGSDEGRRWLPEFSRLSQDEWVPAERGAELAFRLARGDADELSGRALHVMNDLDELIARANEVSSGDRLTMRIVPGA